MKRTAIITGATKGLGREISLSFARSGFNIVGTYSSDEISAYRLREELESTGAEHRILRSDVTEGAKDLFELPEITSASSLVLVNNACPGFQPTPMHQVSWEDVDRQIGIGLKGAWLTSLSSVVRMARQKEGTIINVLTSAVEGLPPKGFSAYAIGKHALRGLTLSLAAEFGARGIRVFSVSPGFMDTEFTRAWDERLRDAITNSGSRISKPDESGRRVVELALSQNIPGVGEDYPI